TTNLTDWALYLAGLGWRVFPLIPGTKRPAVRDWEHRASTDPDRITRCWHAESGWNIGLATGPSELVVLDLDTDPDGPDGAQVLAELATARGVALPATYTVTTPSDGTHLYYRCPPGVRLRNTAGHLGSHLDTRAHGGYVVAPGSVLPSGGYELTDDTDPPDLPAWVVQALTERPAAALSAPADIGCAHPTGYAAAALTGEADRVRHAPPGQHNAVLSRAAYALGQLVGAGVLAEELARAELASAAGFLIGADCDCTPREVDRVITAGLAAGARNPRRATARTSPARRVA
ncbi:MAG TPA: bifunctional DNA primase/polymerase, partial [Pseudonocardiaceae bacterium]|nr:bifunctional DNA primase/polymerase [Pseudonocardiaceae bacterium]